MLTKSEDFVEILEKATKQEVAVTQSIQQANKYNNPHEELQKIAHTHFFFCKSLTHDPMGYPT